MNEEKYSPWKVCDKCHEAICDCVDQYPVWIKCSERMPETEHYVLTYEKNSHPKFQIGFFSETSKRWLRTSIPYPTHWMSIPFPPEDKE